ncbi:3967_t:CDS:1 [Ambispora gerdemannii]|uniref:3967_t:CDS:1 n=1 Tax=Ambispora gerdemannii TaxID=144530 RepID=A0A9N9AQL3_9GLOM|nr:3967_t:CDS:1 [Ambispora gerdemannii]
MSTDVIRRFSRCRRDLFVRQQVLRKEVARQALRYITRNETLPTRTRQQAQLALNAYPRHARPASITNRCTEAGRSRGVFREHRLCRFQFRMKALNGELPGVKKAVW